MVVAGAFELCKEHICVNREWNSSFFVHLRRQLLESSSSLYSERGRELSGGGGGGGGDNSQLATFLRLPIS